MATLRIELAEADARAPVIEARRDDIVVLERVDGPGGPSILVRLDPTFDAPLAAMTQGREGQDIIIRVCGTEVFRPKLMDALSTAEFMLSIADAARIREVEAALRAPDCESLPTG